MKFIATIRLKDNRIMKFELNPENAPISVKNFVDLAEKGHYRGLIFHRCIADFMIQGGGFDKEMKAKDNLKPIKGEFYGNKVDNKLKHKIGTISMARTNIPDSATSQFFICVNDCPHLDGQYAAFGDAVDEATKKIAIEISKVKIGNVGYYSNVPKEPIIIDDIEIYEIE